MSHDIPFIHNIYCKSVAFKQWCAYPKISSICCQKLYNAFSARVVPRDGNQYPLQW